MTGAPLPTEPSRAARRVSRSMSRRTVRPSDAIADAPRLVAAISSVSPGKNVGRRGEDIVSGTTVLERPRTASQDLGVMSSIGHASARVLRILASD